MAIIRRKQAPKRTDGRTTDTKEQILLAALRLFSEKGYEGTSVVDITAAAGVSAPALYKHFESKQALFDEILRLYRRGYNIQMNDLRIDFLESMEKRAEFTCASEDKQVEIVQQLFLHALEDEVSSLFRKLITIEQFDRHDLAVQYNRRYVDSQIAAFEALMAEFIEKGVLREGDAHAMALQYASPIITYLGICDREPGRKREALDALEAHVRQFNAAYRSDAFTDL